MRRPEHQDWHDALPDAIDGCECDGSYFGRDLVDPRCYYHRMIEVVEILREFSWVVTPPVPAAQPTKIRWASEK